MNFVQVAPPIGSKTLTQQTGGAHVAAIAGVLIGANAHKPPIKLGTTGEDEKYAEIRDFSKNKNRQFYRWFKFGIYFYTYYKRHAQVFASIKYKICGTRKSCYNAMH